MKTSIELTAELAALKAEYASNDVQIEALKKRQVELRSWGLGLIPSAEKALAEAIALEADAHLPSICIIFYAGQPANVCCVLEKVTAKRIILRYRGTQNKIQFEHDGNEAGKRGYYRIHPEDLKKILGGQ